QGPPVPTDVEDAGGNGLALREDPELVLLARLERREGAGHEDSALGFLTPENLGARIGLRPLAAQEKHLDVVALENDVAQGVARGVAARAVQVLGELGGLTLELLALAAQTQIIGREEEEHEGRRQADEDPDRAAGRGGRRLDARRT